jgi:gamma-glutamyltranspeptidase
LGASGGPRIITATLQSFLNHVISGFDLFVAVSMPRIHDQLLLNDKPHCAYDHEDLLGGETIRSSDKTLDYLVDVGHEVEKMTYLGTCQAISIDYNGRLTAVSDVRKGGKPAGY